MNRETFNQIEQIEKEIDELAIPLIVGHWEQADSKLKMLLPRLKNALQQLLEEKTVNDKDRVIQEQIVQVLGSILKAWQAKDSIQLADLLQYDLVNLFHYYQEKDNEQ